jgi:hypothetical protein
MEQETDNLQYMISIDIALASIWHTGWKKFCKQNVCGHNSHDAKRTLSVMHHDNLFSKDAEVMLLRANTVE